MAEFQWAVLCSRVITETATNAISYIDSIEELSVAQLPANLHALVVGTLWERQTDTDAIEPRILMLAPSGEQIVSYEATKAPFESFTRRRVNLNLSGAPISETGEYQILVEQNVGENWEREATLVFGVSASAQDEVSADEDEENE